MTSPRRSCRIATSPALRASAVSLLLAAGLLAAWIPAKADTIRLTGGRVLHASDCRREGQELRCAQAGGVIGLPIDHVEKWDKEALPSARRPAVRPAPDPLPPVAQVPGAAPGHSTPAAARARIDALTAALGHPGGDAPGIRRELAVLHALLGNAAMLANEPAAAQKHYRDALAHDPHLDVARLNLCTALINLGSFEEAQAMLAALIDGQPGNARAMDLMGEAHMRAGRLDEAIGIWEKALALKPGEALSSKLAKARRLKSAEEGFRRSDAAHFSLKFDGDVTSSGLAEEILAYLEESYFALGSRFAHYPENTIRVTLYSQKAFQEATASPDWVGGLFDGEIRMPVGGLSRLAPQVRRVLVHELTHCFVTAKSAGRAPQWLQEGIAQVMEGKRATSRREALLGPDGPGGEARRAGDFSYPRALSQVEFLLREWSEFHLNDLLDHLARGTDIDASLRAVTGLSYQEFLKAWGDSLAS